MKSWFTRITRSRRGAITLSAFTASVVAMIALSYATWSASALNANLRVDPSTQTVGPGAEFTVSVIHNADVQLTGFQANLHFDQTKLELLGIEPGTEWGSASLYYGIVPQTPTEAFAYANANGVLPNIARFKGPGEGKIEPGPKVGAIVRFRAKAGASDGEFPLTLDGLQALDANFSNIPASKTDGAVVISSAPTATATSTATATQPATSTSTVTPTVMGVDTATATPTASTTPPATSTATPTPGLGVTGIVFVSPALQSVEQGTGFTVLIKHNVQGATTGIAAEVAFDPELVQIVDVQPGTPYLGADLTVGTGQAKAEAIAEANVSGTLTMSLDLGDGSVPAGDADAFRLIMQAKLGADGVSPIELTSATVSAAVPVLVTRIDGLVEVVGAGTPTATPTAAVTATATATAPASSTPTATPAALTPTATATRTNTPVPTPTATRTATVTATATVPATATATTTVGALSSSTATGTATNTPAPTNTTTSASATATSSPTATRTTVAGSATAAPTVDPATAQGTIGVTPPTITVPPGAEFTLILVQQASFATTGAETDVKFDPALLKVVSVEKSQAYAKASLLAGVAPEKLPDAIASANASGTLKNVATFFVPGSGSIPAGQEEFVRIKMQASASASNTTTAVKLADFEMLNEAGEPLTVAAKDGQVTIQSGAAVPTPPGASSTVAGNAVAGTSASPSKLPSAGTSTPYGELNWALTISLIAVLASGGALVGSLARAESDE